MACWIKEHSQAVQAVSAESLLAQGFSTNRPTSSLLPADEADEAWAVQQRSGRTTDAILSCPGCFTTLCIDCQQHELYHTQVGGLAPRLNLVLSQVEHVIFTVAAVSLLWAAEVL